MCRTMLDTNRKKYEERCERNRKNAKGKSGSERERVAASGSESQPNINININKDTTTPPLGGGGGVNACAPEEKPTTTTTKTFDYKNFVKFWNNSRAITQTRLPALNYDKLIKIEHQKNAIAFFCECARKKGIRTWQHLVNLMEFVQVDKYLNGRTERRKSVANIYVAFASEKIIGGIIDDFLSLGK